MGLAAGHQHHALLHGGIGHPPFHGELAGDGRERLAETVQIERQGIGADFMAHEEPATLVIRVVAGLGYPAVIGSQEVTDLGYDADAVRTGNHQTKCAHGGTLQRLRKGGHSSQCARKLQ
ncbi:hypothetical protein D3C81_1507560 [compost metagenome]